MCATKKYLYPALTCFALTLVTACSDPPPEGPSDEPECSAERPCGEGLTCDDRGICVVVERGGLDQPCYGNLTCDDDLACNDEEICTVVERGGLDQPCYDDLTCDDDLACNDEEICVFVERGGLDQPCNDDHTCDGDLVCNDSAVCIVVERGGLDQPCTEELSCDEGLMCLDGETCAEPLDFGPCDEDELPPGYRIPADLECVMVDVPLDHSNPDGPTVTLRVAIHRSLGTARTGVFQLAGGPGGSSVAQAGIIPMVMPELREEFDLVYVDQRGSGASGYMECADDSAAGLERCAGTYSSFDLNHYLTVDAADDLDWVRRRLGYDTIMLRGGSYGTRLGLEYARRYPDRIAALVLDGLVNPDDDFFTSVVRKTDLGIAQLLADCAADSACRETAPELEADLNHLLEQSQDAPRTIYVNGVRDIEDEWLFKLGLKYFVEDWYWRFSMPRAIHECAAGNCSRWDSMMSELLGVTMTSDTTGDPIHIPSERPLLAQSSYVAIGLYITIVCSEFLPNVESLDALYDLAEEQLYGDSTDGLEILDVCRAWNLDSISEELRTPVVSDVPTLFMSGAIDFVTPVEGGEHAAETFTNGHHIVIPDATHSTMITSCGSQIITDFFFADGDFDQVDTSCTGTYGVRFE